MYVYTSRYVNSSSGVFVLNILPSLVIIFSSFKTNSLLILDKAGGGNIYPQYILHFYFGTYLDMPTHAAGQAHSQPAANFPSQIRRNSAFSDSLGTVPHARSARSQSSSGSSNSHHGGGLAREGILPAKTRSPYRDKSYSVDGANSRPRRLSANVPEFSGKHLHRLQTKVARRSSVGAPPMVTDSNTPYNYQGR